MRNRGTRRAGHTGPARRSLMGALGRSAARLAPWILGLAACSAGAPQPAAPEPAAAPATAQRPAATPPAPPQPEQAEAPCPRAMALDEAAIREEAVCLLRRYVRIDTTNPPGNELVAARFLKRFLEGEGIEATILETAPGRANLIARLRGDGSKKALALVHHMDVVPAIASEWQVPPFEGALRDGYVWGRGAIDNKGPGVMELVSVALLKRLGDPLARDVVLLAVSDEESGGAHGAGAMVEQHLDLLRDVEFALNEGGAVIQLPGGKLLYNVEIAQKAPLWLKIVAEGPAGHASTPRDDSAPRRLVRALARLERHEFPVNVVPEVQAVFSARARAMPPDKQAAFRDLTKSLKDPAFRKEFLKEPMNRALVTNTLSITMLSGSPKENVVPAEAWAIADARLLPGQDPKAVVAELEKVMSEPSVKVTPILSWKAHSSPFDTELVRAIGELARRRDPGAAVTPNVIAGFTDCNKLRSRGITCYGFMPLRLTMADAERVHGRDERVSVEVLGQGAVALHELVRSVAGRAAAP